ncbi:hypothetical protein BGX31_000202, partial [Mortierella sp. GBA43]
MVSKILSLAALIAFAGAALAAPTSSVQPTRTATSSTAPTVIPTTTPSPGGCFGGYLGKRNGEGPNGACCSHSDDCEDSCIKG